MRIEMRREWARQGNGMTSTDGGTDFSRVALELLGDDESSVTWLASVASLDDPEAVAALPAAHELAPVLLDLAVPHEDIDLLVSLAKQVDGSAALTWMLTRCVHSFTARLGQIGGLVPLPSFRNLPPPLAGYFPVLVCVAALPHAVAYHQSRGIPDDVSRRTFADLGRNIAVHRKRHGVGGLHAPGWQTLHLTGALYDLGRLQFERARLGKTTSAGMRAAGFACEPGDFTLSVHIPDFSGPMSPEACDASFAQARAFFARHFPDERFATAVCHSWLMDEQLVEYLPEPSNIMRFQKRFRLAYQYDGDHNDGPLGFVFGRTIEDLDELPCDTTLQRAIVDHIRGGGQWHGGAGWLEL